MADGKRKLCDQDIQGLKYFRKLQPLLARLHEVGAERDVAGNRALHMDQYCTLILLWLFSPLVDSLRGLQQASELDKVARLAWLPKSKGKALSAYRLHTHFEVLRGVPTRIDVTGAKPKGAADERAVLEKTIEADRCYLID